MKYDPAQAPAPETWLALDEDERLMLAEDFHKKNRIKLPNTKLHAVLHVMVENQIAGELEAVQEALDRLMAEGLDRHEALHAIGTVLLGYLNDMIHERQKFDEARYNKELKALNKKSWYKSLEE